MKREWMMMNIRKYFNTYKWSAIVEKWHEMLSKSRTKGKVIKQQSLSREYHDMDLFQMTSPLGATKSKFYFPPAVKRSICEDDFIIYATSVSATYHDQYHALSNIWTSSFDSFDKLSKLVNNWWKWFSLKSSTPAMNMICLL